MNRHRVTCTAPSEGIGLATCSTGPGWIASGVMRRGLSRAR
jgi:hypothetical protein